MGKDLFELSPEERARMGLFGISVSVEIPGLTNEFKKQRLTKSENIKPSAAVFRRIPEVDAGKMAFMKWILLLSAGV